MEEYIGRYYVFKTHTKVNAREYNLNITDLTKDEAKFSLELAMSGRYGSVGKTWEGECYLDNNTLILQCKQLYDWRYTFLDEEKDGQISYISNTYIGTFSKERKNIRLDLSFEVDKIFLYKIDRDEYNIAYWISRNILEHHKLEERVLEFDPHRFWCISNLVFKEIHSNEIDNLELLSEYDIEFRLEEKRVINADEIISEHHIDKVTLDEKGKILHYEFIE